ncbi:Sulfotransferase 1C2A [Amphibalanus amphitrite]|uniref:Sulfotransferase 1C2A n=1 Tax=Amphibalanus amphitrite TaxID=1232801 RepID=A0A6A4W7L2_AMPAM|nr:sulfotransferase 1E1-like [Amphibalanus amphitrite]KAF0303386.1 Sulfotransferase 1C2A [Amphibalanus amphitrite]KAF0303387.1 Sulfotransferase 1C2A [Amphibalanus amphitrite]
MSQEKRLAYPYKIRPLQGELQEQMKRDFEGTPSGLAACNHWGFKLMGKVTDDLLEDIYNYPLEERDVWIMTPPKSGTTWAQEMIWLLANDLDYEGAKTPLLPNRWLYPEAPAIVDKDGIRKFLPADPEKRTITTNSMAGNAHTGARRFVKSHLPLSMNNPRLLDVCKVVYVARNPKDVCVSYYNHNRLMATHGFTGNLELFMQHFMDGNIKLNPCIDHMIEAWNLRHHPNMCFIFYEDMKRDLKSQIRKVAKFLGKDYSEEQVNKLAEHLHIDNFKKNPYVNMEHFKLQGVMHKDRGNFIRKGKTGDWKNHFTPEMTEKFDKWLEQKLKGTDLKFVTELDQQD